MMISKKKDEDLFGSGNAAKPNVSRSQFKPILFSTQMVQAILSGNKTQTRRVVKFPKDFDGKNIYQNGQFGLKYSSNEFEGCVHRLFPKWKVGDILWVRETWQQEAEHIQIAGGNWSNAYLNATGNYIYKADGVSLEEIKDSVAFGKWKPSLFMPKEACRLFLEVTDIRVERIKDINENDALAEGIVMNNIPHPGWYWMEDIYSTNCPIFAYHKLWEKINGQESLVNNDWVWVITFKVIECPKGFC